MDSSLLASVVVSVIAGIVIAAVSERGHVKEIALMFGAGIALTSTIYSLTRIALLLAKRPDYCFYASTWELGHCYADLLMMSGVGGFSAAIGAYLLGLALRGDKQEPQASKARGLG